MARAGRIDDQHAGVGTTVLIHLRSGENENVLEAGVFVQRHTSAGTEAQQRCGRSALAIAVQPVNIDPRLKGLPRKLVLPAGNLEEIAARDLVAAELAFVRLEEELSRLKEAFRLAASDRMIEEA